MIPPRPPGRGWELRWTSCLCGFFENCCCKYTPQPYWVKRNRKAAQLLASLPEKMGRAMGERYRRMWDELLQELPEAKGQA